MQFIKSLAVSAIMLISVENLSANQNVTLSRGPYLQRASSHEMMVCWRSSVVHTGSVYYGISPGLLTNVVSESSGTLNHEVLLSGLNADTPYFYQINDGTNILVSGADYFFQTAPETGSGTARRIWVLGDSGTGNADAKAVYAAYTNFNGSQYTDLMLMLGDNAYTSGKDSEYQKAVFDIYPEILRQTPWFSCYGNHDGYSSDSATQTGPYFDIFNFPTNGECGGVASGTEAYYSFDFGNVHILSLDSFESDRSNTGPMYTWLEQDLAANTSEWLIAIFHHPPYSKGSHDSDTDINMTEMRENYLPLLEHYGVDLVLGAHSHSYERSYLLHKHYGDSNTFNIHTHAVNAGNGKISGDGAYLKATSGPYTGIGAVYAVAGSSGKISNLQGTHPAMVRSLKILGSLVLDVTSNRMDVTFIGDTGTTPDNFTLLKVNVGPGDSDGDGLPDAWELYYFYNPTNAVATADDDGDGLDNLSEYVAGTRPRDSASLLSAQTSMLTNGTLYLVWPSITGRTYSVVQSHNLLSNQWSTVANNLPATMPTNQWLLNTTTNQAFYRIDATLP